MLVLKIIINDTAHYRDCVVLSGVPVGTFSSFFIIINKCSHCRNQSCECECISVNFKVPSNYCTWRVGIESCADSERAVSARALVGATHAPLRHMRPCDTYPLRHMPPGCNNKISLHRSIYLMFILSSNSV